MKDLLFERAIDIWHEVVWCGGIGSGRCAQAKVRRKRESHKLHSATSPRRAEG